MLSERQAHLRPQRPAAQQDKTIGRTELPHRRVCLWSKAAEGRVAKHYRSPLDQFMSFCHRVLPVCTSSGPVSLLI